MRLLPIAAIAAVMFAAAPPDPVTWKVQEAPAKPVKSRARFTVKLLAKIQDGWHMYGLKPIAAGPIPTRVWIGGDQPVRLAAPVQGTAPQTLHDPSFDMELQLYEREASFTLPLRLADAAAAGALKIVVSASYQACDNKICLPPKAVQIEVPITVAK